MRDGEPEVPEEVYATRPENSINSITGITSSNQLTFKIKGLDNVELTLEQLKTKAQFNLDAITYDKDSKTITFGDDIISVEKFKLIKAYPGAKKSLPYKITILVKGEGENVEQYKLALYLSADQSKVEAAIEKK